MMIKTVLIIALSLALAVTLTIHGTAPQPEGKTTTEPSVSVLKTRTSRFLAQDPSERNPRAADHCHKDGEVCAATNTTCCNNKCIDLITDKHNCGACKNKCKFADSCCRGECVNLAYDKRHCGSCGNKCLKDEYCVYGLCNYA